MREAPTEHTPSGDRPSLLIADDHRMLADAIHAFLKDRYEVIGIVSDGATLIDCIQSRAPDVVLADIGMPNLSGLDVLHRMGNTPHRPAFVFMSVHAEPALVRDALTHGAVGYVLKGESGHDLLHALDEAVAGRTWISPALRQACDATPASRLTAKQTRILTMIAEGMKSREIAASLDISTRTVETHRLAIMRALDVNTSIALVNRAIALGLLLSPRRDRQSVL